MEDIAINYELWGYKVGRAGRVPKQVIRIRKAKLDRPAGYLGALMVIFQGLAQPGVPRSLIPTALSKPSWRLLLHFIMDTIEKTGVVVAKMSRDERAIFSILAQKEGGLCKAHPIPSRMEEKIVFYRKWTVDCPTVGGKVARVTLWKKNISNFCAEFFKEHMSGEGVVKHAAEAEATIMNNDAGDPVQNSGAQNSEVSISEAEAEAEEANQLLLQNLFNGNNSADYSFEEAEELAWSCHERFDESAKETHSTMLAMGFATILALEPRGKEIGDHTHDADNEPAKEGDYYADDEMEIRG
ncbi:hypothetical protein B0H63DRAFT_521488 [Podospora didyma]|uniref:Uncharacterized protein n=1 Tax=Podospora didyma TaxID=330526 RepID=A0AAE0NTK8_9PEZI|nr:hypothetical protein B0H63DRAFT_521488 [Podospora didyma]